MPKKSRRLPGGKFRKPLAQRTARETLAAEGSPGAADALVDEELDEEDGAVVGSTAPAPAAPAAAARTPMAPPAAPRRAYAADRPAAVAPAAPVRRAGVGARRAGTGAMAPRRSSGLMELAAANYGHIRRDLARIAVLAVIMLAIIVGLSFVLK